MKKIYSLILAYHRAHFDAKAYFLLVTFLFGSMALNYYFDFENTYIDSFQRTPYYWVQMFWWQAFPFLTACGILYWRGIGRKSIVSLDLWLKVIFGFSLLALYRSFYLHESLLSSLSNVDFNFIKKCVRWASSLVTVVLPLMGFYWLLEKDRSTPSYGLSFQKFNVAPYFMLLAIAVVCIGIGSFFNDIQLYYPRFANSSGEAFATYHNLPTWVAVVIYESCYGLDFLAVELFFRGFLIFAFLRILGGHAVLPMVATYCFLHFGKPLPEAISSIFGGYILGIIAYNTKNIWGGVIIHVGIAFAMELFGWLQRTL